MGVMTKEIKKVKGREAVVRNQDYHDELMIAENNARTYKENETLSNQYLQQLHYGIDRLLAVVEEQDNKIETLLQRLEGSVSGRRRLRVRPQQDNEVLDLARALHTIEKYRAENGRITWSKAQNPKEVVFAFLRKAQSEGLNIENTTAMQSIPQYRRVFQYVVYNVSSWKEIVSEYYAQRGDSVVAS